MTKDQWLDAEIEFYEKNQKTFTPWYSSRYMQGSEARHKSFVEKAIREGKPVPPEVLADYPDLQPKPTSQPAPPVAKDLDTRRILSEARELDNLDTSGAIRKQWIERTGSSERTYEKPEGISPKTPWVKKAKWEPDALSGRGAWMVDVVIGNKTTNYAHPFNNAFNNPDFAAAKALITEAGFRLKKGEHVWDIIEGISHIKDEDKLTFVMPKDQLASLLPKRGKQPLLQKPVAKAQAEDIFTPAKNWVVQQSDAVKGFLGSRMDAYDRWKNAKGATAKRGAKAILDAADKELEQAKKVHHDAVEQAFNEGKTVPPDVLKDYPDLANLMPPKAMALPVAKAQAKVTQVAKTEGTRSAKDIKSELVKRLEDAIKDAPSVLDEGNSTKITIDIPDDGTFTVFNTKENLQMLLNRASKISTTPYEKKTQKPQGYYGVMPNDPKSVEKAEHRDKSEKLKAIAEVHGETTRGYRAAEAIGIRAPKEWLKTADEQTTPPAPNVPTSDAPDVWSRIEKVIGKGTADALKEARTAWNIEKDYEYRGLNRLKNTVVIGLENAFHFRRPIAEKIASDLIEGRKTILDKLVNLEPIKESELNNLGTYPSAITKFGYERGDKNTYTYEGKQKITPPPAPMHEGPGASPTGPGIVGMGGAVPAEFQHSPNTPTGIRNAIVDQERSKRGLPPAMQPAKRAFPEVWDKAMALIDRDPGYQDRLIDELGNKPRALTDTEDAALLHRQIDLQNEYGKATRDLAQAYDDGRMADVEQEKLRVAGLSDRLQDLYDIGKKAGTETARGLSARRMMAYEDFTLAKMELEKRAANGGRQLTDAERSEIVRLQKQIETTQKAYDDYVANAQAREAALAADAAMQRLKAEAAAKPAFDKRVLDYADRFVKGMETVADRYVKDLQGKMWSPTPDMLAKAAFIGATRIARGTVELAKWTDEMASKLGDSFRPYAKQVFDMSQKVLDEQLKDKPEPVKRAVKKPAGTEGKAALIGQVKDKFSKGEKSKISYYINQLARQLYEEEGIRDRETMVDALHSEISQIVPEMSREDVRNAFSGYGDFKPLSKDEITIALRGMKGELQQIAKLEAMASGEPPLKSGLERRTPTEAERQLVKLVNDAKYKFQVPVSDPTTQLKSALDTLKTTLKNRITDYEDRLARKDFAPKPRREIVLDRTAMELKAEAEKVKRKWKAALAADQLKNRSTYEKTMDTIAKWRRGFVLSGLTTLGKLTSAAVQRMTFTPTEELIGLGWKQLPGIRGIAEQAPREGGLSVRAETKAIAEAFTQGMKDSWQVLKTGKGTLDYLFGTKDSYIGELDASQRSIVDFFGQLHGALKAPVKRAEFARSFQKRLEWNAKRGVDVTDPLVQARLSMEAYKDANRAIFLQDNFAADRVRRFINSFEEKQKATGKPTIGGKATATGMRVLMPITKVPANIVAETFQYAIGLERGLYKAAKAIKAGTENLKPEEADLIMRDLKKGAIGSALLLLGFFSPQLFGGYYQPGQKRKKGDVKFGMARVFGVDIPSFLMHNPLLETLQLGATVRRVAESKLRKKDKEQQGITSGMLAGALGLTEQVPFVREMIEVAKIQNPYERGNFFGELGKSIIIPQGIQQIARYFDKDWKGETVKRKPMNMWQHIETGIPGLRQNVPKAPKQ